MQLVGQSYRVNALGPLMLAQAFIDHVASSENKKIVVLSSKAGSFALSPKLPMMYGYRGSKTALNMYMYTLSFETARRGVTVTMISPGQVDTDDRPGQRPGTLLPRESVASMMSVIEGITPDQNGQFLNYESGEVLAW